MIVRPNSNGASVPYRNDSDMGHDNLGHMVNLPKDTSSPTPNSAANVHRGAANSGYGFATDDCGENDYPRADPMSTPLGG